MPRKKKEAPVAEAQDTKAQEAAAQKAQAQEAVKQAEEQTKQQEQAKQTQAQAAEKAKQDSAVVWNVDPKMSRENNNGKGQTYLVTKPYGDGTPEALVDRYTQQKEQLAQADSKSFVGKVGQPMETVYVNSPDKQVLHVDGKDTVGLKFSEKYGMPVKGEEGKTETRSMDEVRQLQEQHLAAIKQYSQASEKIREMDGPDASISALNRQIGEHNAEAKQARAAEIESAKAAGQQVDKAPEKEAEAEME